MDEQSSLPAVITVRKTGNVSVAGSQPSRTVEQARLAYLSRRFAPHVAAAVAPLIYGYGEACS